MILYNITINIDSNVANLWLDYMKTKHISDVYVATDHEKISSLVRATQGRSSARPAF